MQRPCTYGPVQSLYNAACAVLRDGQPSQSLAKPLQELDDMCRFRETEAGRAVVAAARDLYVDSACDIDVDDETIVYDNEEFGWWVMGWCFVARDEVNGDSLGG